MVGRAGILGCVTVKYILDRIHNELNYDFYDDVFLYSCTMDVSKPTKETS